MTSLNLKDVFSFTYDRIKLRFPSIKPLCFIEYDLDDPLTCAYENGKEIVVALGRCLEFYEGSFSSKVIAERCTGLLAHEFVHDLNYDAIKPSASVVLKQSTIDSESVPYHVQFAIMGHRECLQKVKEYNVWLVHIVRSMVKVRDEVTRYLNERNSKGIWIRNA